MPAKKKKAIANKAPVLGRPTKYRPEYCQKAIDYFNAEPYLEEVDDEGNITRKVSDLPTFQHLASILKINQDTLYEWAKKHPAFSEALTICKQMQQHILITNALKGNYTPGPAIFALKNLCNWRDKSEVEHTGNIQQKITVNKELAHDKIADKRKQLEDRTIDCTDYSEVREA